MDKPKQTNLENLVGKTYENKTKKIVALIVIFVVWFLVVNFVKYTLLGVPQELINHFK